MTWSYYIAIFWNQLELNNIFIKVNDYYGILFIYSTSTQGYHVLRLLVFHLCLYYANIICVISILTFIGVHCDVLTFPDSRVSVRCRLLAGVWRHVHQDVPRAPDLHTCQRRAHQEQGTWRVLRYVSYCRYNVENTWSTKHPQL